MDNKMKPFTVIFQNYMDSVYCNPYKHCIIMAEDYIEAEEIFYGDNPELDILWIVETDDYDVALNSYYEASE